MNTCTKRIIKKNILTVIYFPFQLLLAVILSPILCIQFAVERANGLAFDDAIMVADNPMLNPDGPTMQRKRRHCWLMRFVNPWILGEIMEG